jgi:hypothetical protein
MMADDPNKAQGCAGWFKWLVGTGLGLLAAGGSVVAILQYVDPPHVAVPAPASNQVLVVAVTNEPTPDPADVSPEQWQAVSGRGGNCSLSIW